MSIRRYAVFLVAIAGFVLAYNAPSYGNEGDHGPWGIGLRGGFAIYSQNLNNTGGVITTGSLGPVIEGEVQYDFSKSFSVGLGTEWEYHNTGVNLGVGNVGNINTVSILPFARYQFNLDRFHPYFNLGLGYNINTFNLAGTIAGIPTAGLVAFVNNSFAVKPGVGLDYFIGDSWALNAEFDWKWNSANFTAGVPAVPYAGTVKLNMSSLQFLVGARYFF